MSLILSKRELTNVVLMEIRRHEGCEGVSAVAILEKTRHLPSAANWEISIVVAENGDPAAVQRATAKVQALLQAHHRLAGNEAPRGNKKTPPE
jgi:hypothetical protein